MQNRLFCCAFLLLNVSLPPTTCGRLAHWTRGKLIVFVWVRVPIKDLKSPKAAEVANGKREAAKNEADRQILEYRDKLEQHLAEKEAALLSLSLSPDGTISIEDSGALGDLNMPSDTSGAQTEAATVGVVDIDLGTAPSSLPGGSTDLQNLHRFGLQMPVSDPIYAQYLQRTDSAMRRLDIENAEVRAEVKASKDRMQRQCTPYKSKTRPIEGDKLKAKQNMIIKGISVMSDKLATDVPFSIGSKRVFESALEHSRKKGHNYIASEDIAITFFNVDDGGATSALQRLGVNKEELASVAASRLQGELAKEGREPFSTTAMCGGGVREWAIYRSGTLQLKEVIYNLIQSIGSQRQRPWAGATKTL
eukprot:Gb_41292 [translate_table: standard]